MGEFSLITAENSFLLEPDTLTIIRPGLWPSEASVKYMVDGRPVIDGKCMRAAWFRNMNYSKDGCGNPGQALKWDLGRSAEAFTIERWKRMGIYKANAVKFFDRELSVSGELDCVVKNNETGGLIGIEIKSFYGHPASQELCGSKRPPVPGKPKPENFLQAVIYRAKFPQLEQYRLYYIERGDGHRVEFEVGIEPEGEELRPYYRQIDGPYWGTFSGERVFQPYVMNDIYNRYRELKKKLVERDIPPREFTTKWDEATVEWAWVNGRLTKSKYEKYKTGKEELGDWQCSYCDYMEACRNADCH
jgi:hypothetical protein